MDDAVRKAAAAHRWDQVPNSGLAGCVNRGCPSNMDCLAFRCVSCNLLVNMCHLNGLTRDDLEWFDCGGRTVREVLDL